MLYLVIERFNDAPAVYARFREKGRMMPSGLNYISSWIDHDMKRCWQIMETKNSALFDDWQKNWSDLMQFEIIPVRTSAETAALISQRT